MIRLLLLKEDMMAYNTDVEGLELAFDLPETHHRYRILNAIPSEHEYRLTWCYSCATADAYHFNVNFNNSVYYDFRVYPKELR